MSLNIEKIRTRVTKAISVAPFTLNLYRRSSTSDNFGGTIIGKTPDELVLTCQCLFDNSASSSFAITLTDGGKMVKQSSPYLIIVYDAEIELKPGDYFEEGNCRYEIDNATNVLSLDIYYLVNLTQKRG